MVNARRRPLDYILVACICAVWLHRIFVTKMEVMEWYMATSPVHRPYVEELARGKRLRFACRALSVLIAEKKMIWLLLDDFL